MPIRVVTVEDDPQYRSSLELLFHHADDFDLVDSFGSPAAALARLDGQVAAARQAHSAISSEPAGDGAASPWDLVLMDVDLPGMDGIACTRRIKQMLPAAAVVVLTVFEERSVIIEAICAGADGYLLKRTPAAELLTQLRAISAGGAPISAGVARTVLDLVRHLDPDSRGRSTGVAGVDLTDRELEVLRCLVQGMSYKRVAQHLDISLDTVRSHIRAVYSKLQVHSVAEAVSRALRDGLVQ